jgi:hypothetical protein
MRPETITNMSSKLIFLLLCASLVPETTGWLLVTPLDAKHQNIQGCRHSESASIFGGKCNFGSQKTNHASDSTVLSMSKRNNRREIRDTQKYENEGLESALEALRKTSIPLLPNTGPILAVYPLLLGGAAFSLPLSTSILLDASFLAFLYLGRTVVVDDDEEDENEMILGRNKSDFAAFGVAVAVSLLLSPDGFGNANIDGGGMVALGATALALGVASIVSAVTGVGASSGANDRFESGSVDLDDDDNTMQNSRRMLDLFDKKLEDSNKNK